MSYSKQNFRSGDTLYASQLNAMDDEIAALEAEVESTKNMVSSPLTASTAAGMTDQTKIYVYTGSETGYTAGHWYYHNGTAWTDGGVYNSVAVNTDTSLTVPGQAADSKAVGDALDDIDSEMSDVKETLNDLKGIEVVEIEHAYLDADGKQMAFTPNPQTDYACTDFINVFSGLIIVTEISITATRLPYICFYRADKSFLSSELGSSNVGQKVYITVPENASYCRLSRVINNAYSNDFSIGIDLKGNLQQLYSYAPEDFSEDIELLSIGKQDMYNVDLGTLIDGYYIESTTGSRIAFTPTADYAYSATDYIEVYGKYAVIKVTFWSNTVGYAFYNSSKMFISGGNIGAHSYGDMIKITIPNGAKYYRVTKTTSPLQGWYDDPLLYLPDLKSYIDSATAEGTYDFLQVNLGEEIPSYYLMANGAPYPFTNTSSNAYYITDFIDVVPNITMSVKVTINVSSLPYICFYDKNKVFISGQNGSSELIGQIVDIIIPSGTRYFRLSRRSYSGFGEGFSVAMKNVPQSINELYNATAGDPTNPLNKLLDGYGMLSVFEKVGCIGDSLASGECVYSGGSDDIYRISWGQYMARINGNTAYNFSVGGLTTRTWLSRYTGTNPIDSSFNTNVCDAYIIALGQNDSYSGDSRYVELGTTSDIGTSADTFYGNMSRIITKIKELQARARIFILTDPYELNETTGYNDAVRYIAEHTEHCYLVDLYDYALNSNPNIRTNDSLWYGGHLTATGYLMCAKIINTYIDWIINNNLSEFRDVQFIGTNKYQT